MILSDIEYNFIKLQIEKTQLYNKTYYQKRKLEKINLNSDKPKGRKPNNELTMEQAIIKFEKNKK